MNEPINEPFEHSRGGSDNKYASIKAIDKIEKIGLAT